MAFEGKPVRKDVSTGHVERHIQTMQMRTRRLTRLTNAFSKKIENPLHMLSLYFIHCNFCGQHRSLHGSSPAMAAGVSKALHDMERIVGLIDARAPKPRRSKSYRKRQISN